MIFQVVNTARSTHTRGIRQRNATHRGLTQWVGGRRLVRGRPILLDEQEMVQHQDELLAGYRAGMLKVLTQDGVEVGIETREQLSKAPVAPPLPRRLPDSIKYDAPPATGVFEGLPGSIPLDQPAEFDMPESVGVDEQAPPVTELQDVDQPDVADHLDTDPAPPDEVEQSNQPHRSRKQRKGGH